MLLHLTTLDAWTAAVRGETYVAASLESVGFIHLSTPEQVHIPASAIFRDVADVWLLVIDERRLRAPLRFERGTEGDPDGMCFPHLYGPLEVAAVTAIVPYRPAASGAFETPTGLPAIDDAPARARAMEWYIAAARSTSVVWISGGLAIRNTDFEYSYDHNRVVFGEAVTPEYAADVCRRELDGLRHWEVCIDAPVGPDGIDAFAAAGWSHFDNVLMTQTDAAHSDRAMVATGVEVREVEGAALKDFRADLMRQDSPGITDDGVRQLLGRAVTTERVSRSMHVAVFVDGQAVAQLDLRVVGATADIEDVITSPAYGGRGFATALVLGALSLATALGCDVVFLRADADDWPLHLYERLGFSSYGSMHVFDRDDHDHLTASP